MIFLLNLLFNDVCGDGERLNEEEDGKSSGQLHEEERQRHLVTKFENFFLRH